MPERRVYYMVGLNDADTWGILEIGQESLSHEGLCVPTLYRGPFDTRKAAIEREHDIWRDIDAELVLLVRADGVGYLPSSRYPGIQIPGTRHRHGPKTGSFQS